MRSVSHRFVLASLVVLAALFVLGMLMESPRMLRELMELVGVVTLAFFAGRRAWEWWKVRSPRARSLGLLASLGVAACGWLVVAFEWAVLRGVGDSYAMIIVAPLLMILGFGVGVVGLAAAILGIAVVVRAANTPTEHRVLAVMGGAAAVVLNLAYPWVLVRLWG
jgi:hypothetical protein